MKPRVLFTPLASLLAALIFYAAIAGIGKNDADAHRLSGHPHSLKDRLDLAKRQVAHDRRELAALHERRWMLLAPIPGAVLAHRYWLQRDVRYVAQLERVVAPTLGPSWLVSAFMCIHRGEGSWSDSGDPYWGGLQMDRQFMLTYGGDMVRRYGGWANVWPPAAQIEVAIRAWRTRGFYPWPNTARACGLL